MCVCACAPLCVCVSTGQGERTEAIGARCDDRRSLGLKIELCSQHRVTEERREAGGGAVEREAETTGVGEGKAAGGGGGEEGEVIENNVSDVPGEGELTS